MKTNIKKINKQLILLMIFIVVMGCIYLPFYAVQNIDAYATDIKSGDSTVKANFSDSADVIGLQIKRQTKTRGDDFGKISSSIISQIEHYVNSTTKLDYKLIMVVNISFIKNNEVIDNVNGLQSLSFKLMLNEKNDGNLSKDFCAVARLQTNKTQSELNSIFNGENVEFSGLINLVSPHNLQVMNSTTSLIEGTSTSDIKVTFQSQKEGVYFIYQLAPNKLSMKTLIFIFEIIICIIVLVVLIIMINKKIKQKALQSINAKKNNDAVIQQKNDLLDLDKTEIQKLNLTRRIDVPKLPTKPRINPSINNKNTRPQGVPKPPIMQKEANKVVIHNSQNKINIKKENKVNIKNDGDK